MRGSGSGTSISVSDNKVIDNKILRALDVMLSAKKDKK
jgi:hypothetical protein